VTYDDWERDVPPVIHGDTLWRVKAYRLGLFPSDLAWDDAAILFRDRRATDIADQLMRG
jgi:hypothetical protein